LTKQRHFKLEISLGAIQSTQSFYFSREIEIAELMATLKKDLGEMAGIGKEQSFEIAEDTPTPTEEVEN
jgi:hypothetical protein